jgi:hypothetical protein
MKKVKRNIYRRFGTIIYEFSKHLSDIPNEDITIEERTLKSSILNLDGKCEYCQKNDASTIDHYNSLVKDKMPTEYCNDYWNLIPCCTTCNSSKGGYNFWKWFDGSSRKNPFIKMTNIEKKIIKTKFNKYQEEFDKRHYIKHIDIQKLQELIKEVDLFLEKKQKDIEALYLKTTFEKMIN